MLSIVVQMNGEFRVFTVSILVSSGCNFRIFLDILLSGKKKKQNKDFDFKLQELLGKCW